MSSDVQPGWYPDPDGKPAERYWDGDKWTEQTRPQTVKKSQPKKNGDYIKREKSRYDGLIGWSIIIIIGLIFFSCVTSDDDGETTSTPVVQESNNAEAIESQTEELEEDPCNAKVGNIWVLAEEDGCIDPWPLISKSGILFCDPFNEGVGAVVYQPDEDLLDLGVNPTPGVRSTYLAVNGMATTIGYQEIDAIWKDNPESSGGPKINIGKLIEAGLTLCN